MATAVFVSRTHPDAVFIDIGTTTTDVIPIVAGRVEAHGRTDPSAWRQANCSTRERCARLSKRWRWTSACRAAGTRWRPRGLPHPADVHLWRGDLVPGDVTGGTADGRSPRARVPAIGWRARCAGIGSCWTTPRSPRWPKRWRRRRSIGWRRRSGASSRGIPRFARAVVTGAGAFIAAPRRPCRRPRGVRAGSTRTATVRRDARPRRPWPCCSKTIRGVRFRPQAWIVAASTSSSRSVAVCWRTRGVDRACSIARRPVGAHAGRAWRRPVCRCGPRGRTTAAGIGDDAAHWMAVLAMDQYAHLLAARRCRVSSSRRTWRTPTPCSPRRVPVLAPSRWLQRRIRCRIPGT